MNGVDVFFLLCKFYWNAIVTASKDNKNIAIMYGCLFGIMIISGLVGGHLPVMGMIVVIQLVASVVGLVNHFKGANMRKKRQFFHEIFVAMNFKASDSFYPYFTGEEVISEYATIYSFASYIPVEKWNSRKAELEMYINQKIAEVFQDKTDNQIIGVLVQTAPLPEYIEWTDDYIINAPFLAIGITYEDTVGMNLHFNPHAFIAGESGSGKSNVLKCMIYQSLVKKYDVILIDFKRGVSFSDFSDKMAIYYEYKDIADILSKMVDETNNRLDKFRGARVDNITDYNRISGNYLPRKIIFIDELAELLKTRDKDTPSPFSSIETLTRISRAAGIHLIMGVQRPDSTVINGQIKNNVPFRVCGRFVDPEPSRIMLNNSMASSLPNIKGRFIIKDDDFYEVQGFFFAGGRPIPKPQPVQPSFERIYTASENPKTVYADLFFKIRDIFYLGDKSTKICAVILIGEQINSLLRAFNKTEIQFKNAHELALKLWVFLIDEVNVDIAEYIVNNDGISLEMLLSEKHDDSAFVNQARFAVTEQLESGKHRETLFISMLVAVADFVSHTADLVVSMPSISEKLYKLFSTDGKLPLSACIIWSALAVATEFDEGLWQGYKIKLFDYKSGNDNATVEKPQQVTQESQVLYEEDDGKDVRTPNTSPEKIADAIIERTPKPPTPPVQSPEPTLIQPKQTPVSSYEPHPLFPIRPPHPPAPKTPPTPPKPKQTPVLPPKSQEIPMTSDSFEFDFSNFKK